MSRKIEDRFDAAMKNLYAQAKEEADYDATEFLQMLREHGALETAQSLLRARTVSKMFTELKKRQRPDLSVEAAIFDHKDFHLLFSEKEMAVVRRRLKKYKYPPIIDPLEPFLGTIHSKVRNWSVQHHRLFAEAQAVGIRKKKRTGS